MYNFERIVKSQADLFFNRVLPRYIGLYYYGKGYYFVRKMLNDLDNNSFKQILNIRFEVKKDFLKKSRNIKKICPIKICSEVQFGPGESIVLGHFSHVERYYASSLGPSAPFVENPAAEYKTTYESKSVALFKKSFEMFEYRSKKQLEFQVLKTIFHEYIHFFETFFLKSEQLLTSREEPPAGLVLRAYSLEEADKMDRNYILKMRLKIFIFITSLAACIYILFLG